MSNNIENIITIPQNIDTMLNDIDTKRTINDNKPAISVDENISQTMDAQTSFDDLKNTFEGLREGPNLNHELHTLISTVISSAVAETIPQPPLQNTSTDGQKVGSVSSVESAGPANNQKAMHRLQQVMASDSRFLQQLLDYLQLSSPARKDEHIQNMGLEYKGLPPTLNGYAAKREALFEQIELHLDGKLDKAGLKQQLQPLISYIDPAIIIIDNSIRMEEARLTQQRDNRE